MTNEKTLLIAGLLLSMAVFANSVGVILHKKSKHAASCEEPIVQIRWAEQADLTDNDPETVDMRLEYRSLTGEIGKCDYTDWLPANTYFLH